MTALVPVRNPQAAALLAQLNARLSTLATPRRAYEMDDPAKTSLTDYGQIQLSQIAGGQPRVAGPPSPSEWRLGFRAVGDSIANVRVMLDASREALWYRTISVGDVVSTPIEFELEDETRPDEIDKNIWSGLTQWTYAF